MAIEKRGKHLRVRLIKPVKGAVFRTHDIGKPGHTQRIAMKVRGRWRTQSWIFPLKDIKTKRPNTLKALRKLGVKSKVLKKFI